MKSKNLIKELKKYSSPERKHANMWFFKTGPGQYGEGDKFLGVTVPDCRKVAKEFLALDFKEISQLLKSPLHEVRLSALLILVEIHKQARKEKNRALQKKVLKFYLQHKKYVNNWDLVDLSACYIIGQSVLDGLESKQLLYRYGKSSNMWERRMAMVATWAFTRSDDIDLCLKLSKILLSDQEDLMHKAVGWMLREAWKKDSKKVEKFLKTNYKKLARTTLRYAIERMSESKRQKFLKGNF